jgi:hypothetical protein
MTNNDNDVAALEIEMTDLGRARSELIRAGDELAPSERLQRGDLDDRLYELGQQLGRTS